MTFFEALNKLVTGSICSCEGKLYRMNGGYYQIYQKNEEKWVFIENKEIHQKEHKKWRLEI